MVASQIQIPVCQLVHNDIPEAMPVYSELLNQFIQQYNVRWELYWSKWQALWHSTIEMITAWCARIELDKRRALMLVRPEPVQSIHEVRQTYVSSIQRHTMVDAVEGDWQVWSDQ